MSPRIAKILSLALVTAALVGCGKKDDSYASRRTDKALGARPAGQSTIDNGLSADSKNIILDITAVDAPVTDYNGTRVRAELRLNDMVYDLNSTHFHPSYGYAATSAGQGNVGGYQLNVTASCANQACPQYYILVELADAQGKRLQLGLKYDYQNSVNRWYTIRGPNDFHANFQAFVSYIDNEGNFL